MLLLVPESVPHGAGTRRCVDLWTIEKKSALRRSPRRLRRPPQSLRVVEVFAGCNVASFGCADNAS